MGGPTLAGAGAGAAGGSMFGPVGTVVGAALGAAGGIVAGIGAKESADAQAAAYRYKAGVALLNKQINEQNASWARSAGDVQATISGLKARSQIAETKITQAASGLDVNSGTAAQVRADQVDISAFDQNTIRWNAAKEAYGYETKGAMDVAESGLDTMAADQQEKAGTIAMIGSFINAGSSVASKWSQGSTTGMFNFGA